MLITFEVGNYLSFDQPVQFSLLAAPGHKGELPENTFTAGPHMLLKGAVVYGANASGKSNLMNALAWMRQFVLNSHNLGPRQPIMVTRFKLREEAAAEPAHFEMVFFTGGTTYRYGFEVSPEKVVREWLLRTGKNSETPLFTREEQKFDIGNGFPEGKDLEPRTKENTLFLSVAAQFNGPLAAEIVNWFRRVAPLRGLGYPQYEEETVQLLQNDPEAVNRFIQQADFGIRYLHILDTTSIEPAELREYWEKTPAYDRLFSFHAQFGTDGKEGKLVPFAFEREESEGTKNYLRLAGPILNSLKEGRIAVIDELDASLHPLLTKTLVQLFLSEKTNPKHAQLIFNTHDTNLLCCQIFRRDQIWFAEKNRRGATDIYSLVEIKLEDGSKVRKDAVYEKQYIQGRYGAIPFLGDFSKLVAEEK